jgi:translation initiation factor IF-1
MKTRLAFAVLGLLAALAAPARAKIERVVEKSFPVAPGGTLRVETEGGFIRVEISNEPTVKVVARERIRAGSEAEADELLQDLSLLIEAHGNEVTATAKYDRASSFLKFGNRPVQVDFTVTVPARFSAELNTAGGDIVVGDLDGKLRARTSGGNVRLGRISGVIDAGTSGGNVELVEGKTETKLRTSGGNIIMGHIAGPADVSTSGGDIKVDQIEGALSAHTSGGNVSAGFVGGLRGPCELSTSGGRVRATLEPTTGFNLDASTGGGAVRADGLTITLEKGGVGKSRLSGAVNGGGPALKLRSSGGDIIIATR